MICIKSAIFSFILIIILSNKDLSVNPRNPDFSNIKMSTTISIPRNQALQSALKSSNHSHNNTMSEELSETYSSVLGKRKNNDTSVEELRALNDESSNSIDSNLEDGDNPEKRQKR